MSKKKPKESSRTTLTPKMERFCLNFVKLNNATEAAIQAGYSKRTAGVIAAENLTKPIISSRIAELRKKAEDATIASVIERKQVLTEIIRGRVGQYIDGNRISVSQDSINSAAVQEISTSEVKLGRGDDASLIEVTKLKLRDPVAAISEINKMDGIYKADGPQINIDNRTLNVIVRSPESAALIDRIAERKQLYAGNDNVESVRRDTESVG